MTASSLVLYCESHWDSPFVFTAYVALVEKGLDFEERALHLQAGEHLEGELSEHTLVAKVPTLGDHDFWLSESLAIVEYLDERFPSPEHPALLPADMEERARARQVLSWLRTDLGALKNERSTASIFYDREQSPLSEKAEAAAERLISVSGRLLGGARKTLFSTWSIADADLALMLHRLIANGDPVPENIANYARTIWERPSVRSYVEHARER